MADARSKVKGSQGPFTPGGEPQNLSRGSASESPGKQLGSFVGGLPAETQSTISRKGPVDATQSKRAATTDPNMVKK
jgi:hypothetical protein